MDSEILGKFKTQLLRLKGFLEKRVKKLQEVPDFGDDIDSGDEESDETEEFDAQLSVAQNYKEKLADVDLALEKIGKGEYGICENCGKEISMDVLEVAPESRLCRDCKMAANK